MFLDWLTLFYQFSSRVDHEELYFTDRDIFELDLFDGANFRENVVQLMGKILIRLKDSPSDNVSALKLIIKVRSYHLDSRPI